MGADAYGRVSLRSPKRWNFVLKNSFNRYLFKLLYLLFVCISACYPPKQPKHFVAAHDAEQAHQSDEASQGDEAQASVDTEELVSLRTVREMLKVQESMLRALFYSVVKSLTARVDGVVQSVNSLNASLEFSQNNIFASKLEEAKDEIDQLNSDLAQQ